MKVLMCAQYRLFTAICLLAFCGGCSLKKMAVNKLGDAMASGGSTFESDEDPDLVAAAIPFGLKMYESLLAESPKHTGLLLAAATGFTEYAYAFVDLKAEETQEESVDRADAAEVVLSPAGITFKDIYWTVGAYDLVATFEAPDEETLAAALLALAAQGNLRTTTLRAFTAEEMRGVIAKAT